MEISREFNFILTEKTSETPGSHEVTYKAVRRDREPIVDVFFTNQGFDRHTPYTMSEVKEAIKEGYWRIVQ